MTTNEPRIDPETEAALNRALDAAQLRASDTTTASVIHTDHDNAAVEDDASGD